MTQGCLVRAATEDDAAAITALYAPIVNETAISFEKSPPNSHEVIARMLATPRLPWLVAETADGLAGYAYASAHRQRPAYRWSVDASVYVDPGQQSQGVGRLLYEVLINEVRDLGYVSLFAGIALPNLASVKLHEAMGFMRVGVYRNVGYKSGSWRDVQWWHKVLREPPVPPDEPRDWHP